MGLPATLLIAGRGEIACRIMRTARRLGIRTVAVYSDADRRALHTRLADTAVRIGPSPASESYLNMRAIIDAARDTGTDAIHPGYGFLAENPAFARACSDAGIIFVGPPAEAIEAMAIKGEAKARMEAAGVPVLPGLNEVPDDLGEVKEALGFPLLVKPAAGGGGKGMRIVQSDGDLEEAITAARRVAAASFGDDRLILERYLTAPRHVEIQIFADSHGNAIHLGERDCSLQRRHQKIIEEAPAPFVDSGLRERMGEAAVTAAKAIGYVGAGTVEFLLDAHNQFYFMEMNTRLQVEHPVTEMITGLDLVEWQLRVAGGEPLPIEQGDVSLQGHAMEARLYAEDPANDFLPASGRIAWLRLPPGKPWLRIDNGVDQGDEVSVFYDPMIAKVVAHAPDRASCIERLAAALADIRISGVRTNRDLLGQVLAHETMVAGRITTDFLDQSLDKVYQPPTERELMLYGAAAVLYLYRDEPWPNFRLNQPNRNQVDLVSGQHSLALEVDVCGSLYQVSSGDQHVSVRVLANDGSLWRLEQDGEVISYSVEQPSPSVLLVSTPRHQLEFTLPMETVREPEEAGSLRAPMAGRVISVMVREGDQVGRGEPLMVLEAMKMEHTIAAPSDGTVTAVNFSPGDAVNEGVELLELAGEETA